MQLLVIKKDNDRYKLIDNNKKIYDLTIYIEDTNYILQEKDILEINEDILDSRVLTFGSINSKYGRDINETNYSEVVTFIQGDKKIFLKRLYG